MMATFRRRGLAIACVKEVGAVALSDGTAIPQVYGRRAHRRRHRAAAAARAISLRRRELSRSARARPFADDARARNEPARGGTHAFDCIRCLTVSSMSGTVVDTFPWHGLAGENGDRRDAAGHRSTSRRLRARTARESL